MKIGQLSENIGISTHTIRYYEKLGLLHQPTKDISGHRVYNKLDVELANWVTCLKKSGMSLKRIKEYNKAFKKGEKIKITNLLKIHLEKLKIQQQDLRHYIEITQNKINNLKKNLT